MSQKGGKIQTTKRLTMPMRQKPNLFTTLLATYTMCVLCTDHFLAVLSAALYI